ncbi:MAG: helix-turn-helix domain-containing protein [Acidimicrobiaceae bacterium]|nr:helix-turn-helix domain-containing protein [Acidimicrobiaceae bacterium]
MKTAFDEIMSGLRDAEAYLDGDRQGSETHRIEVPEPDVRRIRERTGLSQVAFARSIGVAPGTVRNWEQGRRRPQGPARVLLALLNEEPAAVQNMLILGSKRTT